MGSDNTPQCSETEKITVSEYRSEEYIVCPVWRFVIFLFARA